MVIYFDRSQWGARAPKTAPVHFNNVQNLYVHHTTGATLGKDQSDDWVRSIQNFHMDGNGWNDIAYSFLVSNFGQVFEGRGWSVIGAHTLNHNSDGLGFAYLGDGDGALSDAAIEAFRWLIAEFDARYGTKPIHGHRDVGQTHCPGDWLYANLGSLRSDAPVPAPAPPPPPPSGFPRPVLAFPLPGGHWFGPPSPNPRNHSGYYSAADAGGVRVVQQTLHDRGWGIGVDGQYGPGTKAIVEQFQQDKHLGVDGLTGIDTWAHLFAEPVT